MQKIDFVFALNTVILPTSNVIFGLHISTLWRGVSNVLDELYYLFKTMNC